MKQYDVVIAGGAMAGMTLALAINKVSPKPLAIAVVESFEIDHHSHPGYDSRSIALSLGTVNILKSFAMWNDIHPVATVIEQIHVSDRTHIGMTDITKEELGVEGLGYVVELADIGRIYQHKVEQDEHIDLFCPTSVCRVDRSVTSVSVHLDNGEQLHTKLLVAADGAQSTCCELIGLEHTEHDFEQIAVTANISVEQAHQGRAYERFTNQGPIALLPMSDERMSLVWCLHPDEADKVMALDEQEFLRQLQGAFGWRLGKFNKVGQRACFPLQLCYRQKTVSHRFVAVGNAAQALHPIAGQGFNLGIRDVASLAEEIAFSHQDPGCYQVLSRFRQRRMDDREAMISLTSSLVYLFSNDYLSLRIGRNVALTAMDNLSTLKAPLLSKTLGLVAR